MNWSAGIIVLLTAFIITILSGFVFIPMLKRLKFGQTIKEIGPTWHESKNGTPTMGGLLFIIGIFAGILVGFVLLGVGALRDGMLSTSANIRLFAGLLAALGYGFIGFADDYIKVVKRRNLGLKAMQKTVFQMVITICYLATLHLSGITSTIVVFPFLGQVDFGWLYYPIMVLGIYFIVNAVNLTDGIDGLASSVTTVYAIVFMLIATLLQAYTMHIFAAAVAGGCLGFLIWNFYPAKTFMGDTGSMFLGGCVVALAFGIDLPVLILLVGLIYICEALSVVLQVISFKTTGKRIFKMSPIHHHFEMCGWSEVKIVSVFTLITAFFGFVAIICVLFGL